MLKFARKFLQLGMQSQHSELNQHIFATNLIVLVAVFNALLIIAIQTLFNWVETRNNLLIEILIITLVPLMHIFKLQNSGRIFLVLFLNSVIFYNSWQRAKEAEISFYFYALACLPLVLFTPKERKMIFSFLILSVFLFLMIGFLRLEHILPPLSDRSLSKAVAEIIQLCISMGIMTAIIGFFFISNHKKEEQLEQLSDKKKIEQSKLQKILDTMEQGLIVIDQEGRITPLFSKHTLKKFERTEDSMIGENVFNWLFRDVKLSLDSIHQIEQAIMMSMNEEVFNFEVNAHVIPSLMQFNIDSKILYFRINWQPLLKDEIIIGFAILIQDDTDEHIHQNETELSNQKHSEHLCIIAELARSKLPQVAQFVHFNASRIENLKISDADTCLQQIHTMKGVARTLGLTTLANFVHMTETGIIEQKKTGILTDSTLQNMQNHLQDIFQLYDQTLAETFEYTAAGASQSLFENLSQTVDSLIPALIEHTQRLKLQLGTIKVADAVLDWNARDLEYFRDSLMHGFANAIDHGYSFPLLRNESLETCVRLSVNAWREGGWICFSIADSGAGLDPDRLEKIIKKAGFIPKPGQSKIDVLFADGVSSSSTTSMTSGRGVGMGAIRSIATQLGGRASIVPNEAEGLKILLSWPESA